jgi:hypothetical protein
MRGSAATVRRERQAIGLGWLLPSFFLTPSFPILESLDVTPQVFSSLIALHLHKHKQASFISCISL